MTGQEVDCLVVEAEEAQMKLCDYEVLNRPGIVGGYLV
jgi:hypothetical protein